MRLGTAVLALAVGWGVAGLASAQESGTWLTRMFVTADKGETAKKLDVKTEPASLPAVSSNHRLKQAKVDLERRQEVSLKLREIALDTGDDDLLRKADQLLERAFDVYVATVNQRKTSALEPDAKKEAR